MSYIKDLSVFPEKPKLIYSLANTATGMCVISKLEYHRKLYDVLHVFRTEWTVFVIVTMATDLSVGVRMEQPGSGGMSDKSGGPLFST